MFELENSWTDYCEIWFGHYYGIGFKKLEEKNILLSVFTLSFLSFPLFFLSLYRLSV
jgi:hypothetical protein